jgi:hypothetical protein
MFGRVEYLVITELTIATLFAWVFVLRHQMSCCRFLYFSSWLTCGLLKNHRTLQQLCCFIPLAPPPPSAVQVKFHNYNDSVTKVARRLWVLLCAQGTFCFRPRGITFIESTQIRWFSRGSGGGGWSGRDVAQRRPRVSKLG